MSKRKLARALPTLSRTTTPRVLEPTSEPGRLGYPSAADLISSSSEWRRWLDDTLRAVLAPVAVASAIGVAAAGCGSRVADPPGMPIGATSAAATAPGAPGVVLVPIGAQQAGIGTSGKPPAVTATAISTSVGGEAGTPIEPCALTTPAATQAATQGTRPRHVVPTSHPVRMAGRPVAVHPIVPVVDPPQLGGEPPAVDP